MNEQTETMPQAPDRVECPAVFNVRIFIIAAVLTGFGLYCAWDAFLAKDDQGNPKYSREEDPGKYYFNVYGAGLVPIGVVVAVWGVWMHRRKLIADSDGIGYVGKPKIAWDQVQRLVTRGKGLLDVHYSRDGNPGLLKLDSFKLQNFRDLVAMIETKTPEAQVDPPQQAG